MKENVEKANSTAETTTNNAKEVTGDNTAEFAAKNTATVSAKKNKKTRGVVKVVSGVLTCVLLLCTIAIFLTAVTAKAGGKTPVILGYSFGLVATGSMEPEIKKKDFIIAKKVDLSSIKVGDDIVFISDDPSTSGLRIVHRVYAINGDGSFATYHINEKIGGKETAGVYEDDYPAVRVEGKVVHVSHFLGRVMSFMQSGRDVLFAAMLLSLLVVIALQVVRIIKTAAGKDESKDKIESTGESKNKDENEG